MGFGADSARRERRAIRATADEAGQILIRKASRLPEGEDICRRTDGPTYSQTSAFEHACHGVR